MSVFVLLKLGAVVMCLQEDRSGTHCYEKTFKKQI